MLGRMVALGAVVYGVVVLGSGLADGYVPWARALVVAAGALAVAGGALFLLGLDRLSGERARSARAWGWGMFTLAFLLPTSLLFVLLAGSALAFPAIRRRDPPLPSESS
jgi:hypothetical protein